MSYYRICGINLQSNLPFPELPPSSAESPDCTLTLSKPGQRSTADTRWVHKNLRPDGRPWLLFGQSKAALVLRFPRLADFVVSLQGNISCVPWPKIPRSTLRHFFLDNVLPAYLSLGRLVLHASAIRVGEKCAIAFLGESGSGKSTLAACFWKEGFEVIADDCVVIEQGNGTPMCVPSYPGLRLWDDSANAVLKTGQKRTKVAHFTDKSRFHEAEIDNAFDGRSLPLARIYWLEPPVPGNTSGVVIRPISGSEGVVRLLQSSFRLHFERPEPLTEEFSRLVRVTESKLLYGVQFPRDFSRVGEVTSAILDDIGHSEGVPLEQD